MKLDFKQRLEDQTGTAADDFTILLKASGNLYRPQAANKSPLF
ncbi:hypothetical protein [Paenibacillus konkukensis]|nr:hypothetical protein [Paenibacillus konkukensis]